MVLLVVLTAMPGATAVVTGVMLLVGVGSIGDCDSIATTAAIDDDLWWYATYLVLVVAGIASQLTAAATIRWALRAAWSKSGGRQMRSA